MSMKVKTDLKAGNLINDATALAQQSVDYVTGFVSAANNQANDVVGSVGNAATSTWNAVTGLFS
jgi:hypothetical protein